jgi:hypothetical protein
VRESRLFLDAIFLYHCSLQNNGEAFETAVKDARYFDNGQLVIFRREGGNVFHLRTKLDGKYVWRSLRTTSMEEAIARAWKLHHGLQTLHEQGLPVTAKTFASVIEDYVRTREKSCKQGKTTSAMLRQVRRVIKFWLEYAGSKPIHLIGGVAGLRGMAPRLLCELAQTDSAQRQTESRR